MCQETVFRLLASDCHYSSNYISTLNTSLWPSNGVLYVSQKTVFIQFLPTLIVKN
jgi:hypothetical protein